MKRDYKPLYKLFRTSNLDYYLFDTFANKIIKITENIFNCLYDLENKNIEWNEKVIQDQGEEFQKFYQDFVNQGYLKNFGIEKIEHPMNDILEDILENNIESINIQVTQNCNLRCEYCPYTGNYYTNRKHSNKKMDFVMAKKGIDFLVMHSSSCKTVNVSFYGGEPLLEFELIKKCMNYSKIVFEGKEIIYTITSNGVLLTDEVMKYLKENNVLLTISIDGPENIHNRYRVFSDGKGSFEKIYNNLKKFKHLYPDYYNKNIMFNAVLDQDERIREIDEFFSGDDLFEQCDVATTFYNNNYVVKEVEHNGIMDKFIEYFEFEKYKCFLHALKRISVSPTRIQRNNFAQIEKTASELHKFSGLPKKFHPSGPCIPGRKKLFLNVDGNLFPCERVSEVSPCSVIGNIDDGLDIYKCKKLLNIGSITEEKCKHCWAIAQCKLCFIQADNGYKLSAKCRLENCDGLYNSILSEFMDISVLNKYEYHFDEEGGNYE